MAVFATSHGKCPCYGIGGIVKRLVARVSLQAIERNHIFSLYQMFTWAKSNIKGIKFCYLSTEHINDHTTKFDLGNNFSKAKTIAGMRSHHCFIPLSENTFIMKQLSTDLGAS